jgi:disulfide bond formation protein DsbB
VRVDTEAFETFTALLTVVAAVGAVGVIVLVVLARRAPGSAAAGVLDAVAASALWLAAAVATVATLGSLYFSEVANFVPCRLCWFQRVFMYPLAVILLVAAVRRDTNVRWYALPLAGIGAAISGYHYAMERFPSLESASCEATGPLCSVPWFESFGFITLALMALVGFLTVGVLLLVARPYAGAVDTEAEFRSEDPDVDPDRTQSGRTEPGRTETEQPSEQVVT